MLGDIMFENYYTESWDAWVKNRRHNLNRIIILPFTLKVQEML